MNNYIAHLPIRVGFLVQKNRQVLAHDHHSLMPPSHSDDSGLYIRELPFTVAGPRWIFTNFPIKSLKKTPNPFGYEIFSYARIITCRIA